MPVINQNPTEEECQTLVTMLEDNALAEVLAAWDAFNEANDHYEILTGVRLGGTPTL